MNDNKKLSECEIGDEFEKDGFIWVKVTNNLIAIVLDENGDPKKPLNS